MPSASRIGQRWHSTTLLDDGGRPFRVTKRKFSEFNFHAVLYSARTADSAGGSVIGAVLPLLIVD